MEAKRSVSDDISEERWFHNSIREDDDLVPNERHIVKTDQEVCADGLDMECEWEASKLKSSNSMKDKDLTKTGKQAELGMEKQWFSLDMIHFICQLSEWES